MRKSLRTFSFIMLLVLLATSVMACTNSQNSKNEPSATPGQSAKEPEETAAATTEANEEPLKVNFMMMHTLENDPEKDNAMHKWILENKNIDIQFTPATANAADKMNTMLASGDIPDVVSIATDDVRTAIVNKWADAGYIIEMGPWLEKYPNLTKVGDQEYNKLMYSNKKDGKMYMIPGSPNGNKEVMILNVGPFIREDWLKQVGMEAPTTTDELYEVLKAFKEQIPDVDGKPIIPASFDFYRQFFMYSWTQNWYNISDDYKTLHWWFDDPRIEDYMAFMNKLYNEGLLDIETITQQPEQYQAKLSSGRVGFTLNTIAPMDIANGVLKANDPNTRYIPNPPIQVEGLPMPVYQESNYTMYTAVVVSKKFASNERNLERLMEFLDWNASEEGSMITEYGPPDEYFVKNTDGLLEAKPEVKAELDKGDKSFETKTGIRYYNLLNSPTIPRATVFPGTEEVKMAQDIWKPGVADQNLAFNSAGTGDAWNKYWPVLWPEIAKWEAKGIFAKTEEDSRKIAKEMLENYKKIGQPEVTEEKLKLIDEYLQKNNE